MCCHNKLSEETYIGLKMEHMITAKYENGILVSTETKAIKKIHKISIGSLVEVGEIKDEMLIIF